MDGWLTERTLSHPRWEVTLSDGSIRQMDDGRPGTTSSGWSRLRDDLKQNDLKITSLRIAFRGNYVSPVPNNARGYFFAQAHMVDFGTGAQAKYFLVGYVDPTRDVVHISKWLVPTMIQADRYERTCDEASAGLILN